MGWRLCLWSGAEILTTFTSLADLKNRWALVTGASSGIGSEYASQLAAAGVNLVLVARRENRLNVLATDLIHQHAIQAQVLPIDLSLPGATEQIHTWLKNKGVHIRLLVNNAALGYWGPGENVSPQAYETMLRVNVLAVTELCCRLFSDLSTPKGGAIINVSSPAAYQPIPGMAVYAATKSFVHSVSQALHEEWRKRGVLVQTLVPGPSPTDLPGARAMGEGSLCPVNVPVRASLHNLGKGTAVVTTARGTLFQRIFSLLPTPFVLRQVSKTFLPLLFLLIFSPHSVFAFTSISSGDENAVSVNDVIPSSRTILSEEASVAGGLASGVPEGWESPLFNGVRRRH